MRILMTTETYFPWITGVSVSTNNIAKYMASQGHQVTLVYPTQQVKGATPQHKNVTLVQIPSFASSFYNNSVSANILKALEDINKLMNENKFDVVHIQEPGLVGISALIQAKKHKVPTLGALHFIPEQIDRVLWGSFEGILTPIINIYIRFIYNKYDAVMTPSFFFANNLKKIGVKTPINIISNGTDIEKFKPGAVNKILRKKIGFREDDFVFYYMGRLDRDKNIETLVRSMSFTNPNIKLLIVGRGTEKKYLEDLTKKLNVLERIIFVDYVDEKEKPNYYHAVNAFSIMSPYEGQSIVTLDAAASGLPIVTANAGALPELCRDKENGFLISTYNYKDLAKKMNLLAGHKKVAKKFGKESRKIALPHEKDKVFKRLENIYQKLANS